MGQGITDVDRKDDRSPDATDQGELFDPGTEVEISLLTQLLRRSRLYSSGSDYKALLDFVVRLSNFAPFNAMLLQVQKPGLLYAASAHDWLARFNRTVKEGARPLIILWHSGPVALVYDFEDTEGDAPLPKDVADAFRAVGPMNADRIKEFVAPLDRLGIDLKCLAFGDGKAGHLDIVRRSENAKEKPTYRVRLNEKHDPNVQFAALAHELGHLYLGHGGSDKYLKIPKRAQLSHAEEEIEAESVAYIVSARNGVQSESEVYLADYVATSPTNDLDLYIILKAAGQVETALGLSAHIGFRSK